MYAMVEDPVGGHRRTTDCGARIRPDFEKQPAAGSRRARDQAVTSQANADREERDGANGEEHTPA